MEDRNEKWRAELRKKTTAKERVSIPRAKMNELDPKIRAHNYGEVNQGLNEEQAVKESVRCMDCPNPTCMEGCPVGINIPGFIKNIERKNFTNAIEVIRETSALPAVCGRVCPQEKQCESKCFYKLKLKKEPVAIGYLERFVADYEGTHQEATKANNNIINNNIKIAVVGSGPAGLSFAGDMRKKGYDVTIFEALHEIGGVLKYGIPGFRLPNSIVDKEIEKLKENGVHFKKDIIIGKTLTTIDLEKDGFKGIFIASGAGLPRFMGIKGENLIGVLSSNEYLTRVNLMNANLKEYDTPIVKGKIVAVIGGGNTAMDSVRTAVRLGAERAIIIYRRSEKEMPARIEEIKHAKEEGVEFLPLYNPIEYLGDSEGKVNKIRLQKMKLGEPDASGRQSSIPVEGEIKEIAVDQVIVSIGVSPNPIVPKSIEGLKISAKGTIEVNEKMQSALPTLFAGGDIVRGGATVILAMGDGRKAAMNMDQFLKNQ